MSFHARYLVARQKEKKGLNVSLQDDWSSNRQMEGQKDIESEIVEERKDLQRVV